MTQKKMEKTKVNELYFKLAENLNYPSSNYQGSTVFTENGNFSSD